MKYTPLTAPGNSPCADCAGPHYSLGCKVPFRNRTYSLIRPFRGSKWVEGSCVYSFGSPWYPQILTEIVVSDNTSLRCLVLTSRFSLGIRWRKIRCKVLNSTARNEFTLNNTVFSLRSHMWINRFPRFRGTNFTLVFDGIWIIFTRWELKWILRECRN